MSHWEFMFHTHTTRNGDRCPMSQSVVPYETQVTATMRGYSDYASCPNCGKRVELYEIKIEYQPR